MVVITILAEVPRHETRRRYVERRLPPHPEDAARWAAFCASIEDRINEVRAEAADPICGTCGSSTPDIGLKWCWGCQSRLVRERFSRDRTRYDGLRPMCRSCDRDRAKRYRAKTALRGAGRSA